MGIVKDVVSGIQGAKASKSAANAMQAAADQAAEIQKEGKDQALDISGKAVAQARADFQPYADSGKNAISGLETGLASLSRLVTDPNAQAEFINNNPFFDALATRAKSDLFANAAAKGKIGSGGTAEALQNSILLLGSDLLNQNITQRQNTNTQYQNLVNIGLNAAGGQANATNAGATRDVSTITGVANQVADLRTQSGNAQAAGIIGAYNARQDAADNAEKRLTSAAAGAGGFGGMSGASQLLMLCDATAKENIVRCGTLDNGLPIYMFNYIGDDEPQLNVMAQDVERINPSAVIEINGYKYIDIGKAWL